MYDPSSMQETNWKIKVAMGLAFLIGVFAFLFFLIKRDTEEATPSATTAPPETTSERKAPAVNLPETNKSPDLNADANGLSKATVLLLTDKGLIKYKFYPKDAPKTVARIAELTNAGFYNGLTFHRVEPGFVIQGGDPVGNGTGGSGQKLKAEFNQRTHHEGTVAMARGPDPDSADSQFYIAMGAFPHLDRNYTVFGQVIEGMDVVRQIAPGDHIVKIVIQ